MNKIDYLLKTPFISLNNEDKLEIKRLGAHQPRDFTISQLDEEQMRTFCYIWFIKKPWLTASEEKRSLFCFYCVLFGGEELWTTSGCTDLKRLSDEIKKHEESTWHLENAIKYKMFGTTDIVTQSKSACKISIQKHNELVTKNRLLLNKIIECLKFCGAHELASQAHHENQESVNNGSVLDLLHILSTLDSQLHDHLNNTSISTCNYTSHAIQDEMLDCMYQVYIEQLVKDINGPTFVSVQVDGITHITSERQFAIILRFMKENKPIERFLSFVRGNCLDKALEKCLHPFSLEGKLIAQAYDCVIERSVRNLMQNSYPKAKFVQCYSHEPNLVIQMACVKSVKSARLFFANIAGFTTFFSSSTKRIDLLQSVCSKNMPTVSSVRWNFLTRVVSSVYVNKSHLMECFKKIEDDDCWDDLTIRESFSLSKLLNDSDFLFFLNFFYDIMKHVDVLYHAVQMQSVNATTISHALQCFESSLSEIKENIARYQIYEAKGCAPPLKKSKLSSEANLITDARKVCEILIIQMKERFQNSHIFCNFEIIEPKMFATFRENFPTDLVDAFASSYSSIICREKLINELSVMYLNDTFQDIVSVSDLLSFMVKHSLEEEFSEVHKTLQIVSITPVSTVEAERCFSTSKRIKTFLGNSMNQNRLNALAICSVHKEEIGEIPNFNNRVIEMFVNQKNRGDELLYK